MCLQFVKDVVHIVDGQDALKPPELRTPGRALEDHQVWCEKTWKHVLPTVEYWALELRQLKVAYFISLQFTTTVILFRNIIAVYLTTRLTFQS